MLLPHTSHLKFYNDSVKLIHSPQALGFGTSSYTPSALLLSPIFNLLRLVGLDIDQYPNEFHGVNFYVANACFDVFYLGIWFLLVLAYPLRRSIIGMFASTVMIVVYAAYYAVPNKELIPFLISMLGFWVYNESSGIYYLRNRIYFPVKRSDLIDQS